MQICEYTCSRLHEAQRLLETLTAQIEADPTTPPPAALVRLAADVDNLCSMLSSWVNWAIALPSPPPPTKPFSKN